MKLTCSILLFIISTTSIDAVTLFSRSTNPLGLTEVYHPLDGNFYDDIWTETTDIEDKNRNCYESSEADELKSHNEIANSIDEEEPWWQNESIDITIDDISDADEELELIEPEIAEVEDFEVESEVIIPEATKTNNFNLSHNDDIDSIEVESLSNKEENNPSLRITNISDKKGSDTNGNKASTILTSFNESGDVTMSKNQNVMTEESQPRNTVSNKSPNTKEDTNSGTEMQTTSTTFEHSIPENTAITITSEAIPDGTLEHKQYGGGSGHHGQIEDSTLQPHSLGAETLPPVSPVDVIQEFLAEDISANYGGLSGHH
ncbi:hypothetical protein K7432_013988 [Basidiobolus ranarum]|uniref:Uncharacterized protein n=1 Tax=Basidiobolus ranarum TaxID=34480 RepID=A0ABR2WID3_9FUNG